MQSLPDERTLLSSDGDVLVLTTHRVRYEQSGIGRGEVISIMLEDVASTGISHKAHPFLLVLGAILALAAVAMPSMGLGGPARIWGFLTAIGCVVVYALTRRGILSIRSAGHAINIPVRSGGKGQLLEFVEAVDQAKGGRRRGAVPTG